MVSGQVAGVDFSSRDSSTRAQGENTMTAAHMPHDVATLPAFVARIADYAADGPAYLRLAADGAMEWVAAQCEPAPSASRREPTRHATRLPARLRAFGVPRRD